MVLQKPPVRPVDLLLGHPQPPVGVHQRQDVAGDRVPLEEQAVVVVDRDQAAVEHPVEGGAERDAAAEAVRSVGVHGPDVRGLGLGPPAAVDDPETADRGGVVVGPLDARGEHPVDWRPSRLERWAL